MAAATASASGRTAAAWQPQRHRPALCAGLAVAFITRAPRSSAVAAAASRQQQQSSSSPPSPDFNRVADELGQQAQRFARTASRRVADFVAQNELDRKAAAAARDAGQALRDSYSRLDLDLQGRLADAGVDKKLRRAKSQLEEAANDVDARFSLRRRARAAWQDVQRLSPIWRRRAGEYAATPTGKAVLTLGAVFLIVSGVAFKLLNLAWLAWWVGLPVSIFLADQRRRRAASGGGGGSGDTGFGSSSSSSSSGGSWGGGGGRWDSSAGPVVEAEWVSIDDDDNARRR